MSTPLPQTVVVSSRTLVPACCKTLAFKVPEVVTPPAAVTARYLVAPLLLVTLKTSAVGLAAVVCLTDRPVMLVVVAKELVPLKDWLPLLSEPAVQCGPGFHRPRGQTGASRRNRSWF